MSVGTVILVGAGPGDPGLLTVKGRAALERADVVVYDRLVGEGVLALMPERAEQIDVGKQASRHPVPQEQINQILLQKAQEGKTVVRLKGGDPFLFGRGGEELELLVQHGVPFQVLPGVTSALSAPAYAGIPVTHRDFASSLHIVTGHARAGKALDIDFDALVRTGGTLVFLMGVASLPEICGGLLAAGMAPATPAAIVERGTTPAQRRVDGTLATLAARAEAEAVESPAISIFGPVCALAADFDWFDALPLKGRKIVVTRPKDRAGTLTGRLRDLGADVLEYPCIETVPILPCPAMEGALDALADYEWLCFTSPAGVEAFWAALERRGADARILGGVKLSAIGGGTAKELAKHGLRANYVPQVFDAAHLGAGLAGIAQGRVLILRAELGSPDLTAALDRGNIPYDDIAIYRTEYRCGAAERVNALLEEGKLLVTFTSASTVRGFVGSVGEGELSHVRGVCIGAQTAAEAKKYSIPTVTAERADMDSLVAAIMEYERNKT